MMHWTAHLCNAPRRVNHAAAAVGDQIFTFGGYCTGEDMYDDGPFPIDVHILNTNTLSWRLLALPEPGSEQFLVTPCQRYGHTAVAYGKNIYIWGGRNDEAACNRLFCFNTEKLVWSSIQVSGAVPYSRDGHSACLIGDSMYIFGGYEDEFERYSQDVYALDLKLMCWSYIVTEGTPPAYRDFNSGTAIDNRMYIFGGRCSQYIESASSYPNEIMYLDTTTKRWERPRTLGKTPIGRRSHSAFVYDNKLFIFGGYNSAEKEHYNDFHCFDPETNTWRPILTSGVPPVKRRRQVCIVIEHKMYLFGGTSPNICVPHPADETDYANLADLMDHNDLHVLDLNPSLKTLCLLYINDKMDDTLARKENLPKVLSDDLKILNQRLSKSA